MQKLKFVQQDPTVSTYKARIPAEDWKYYENIIRDWHGMGKTRLETLSVLKEHFSFEPSIAQFNAQMTVWGLKTYKRDNPHLWEKHHRTMQRNFVCRAYPENLLEAPPSVQFARVSNVNLEGILKAYEKRLQSDTTRSIHSLWKSASGEESVEKVLEEHGFKANYAKTYELLDTLEYVGDFLLAGGALEGAFNAYSRLLYVRSYLMDQAVILSDMSLVWIIIKCARSAESTEQKTLAFELLELCLVFDSITGQFTDEMSKSLRSYYTRKDSDSNLDVSTSVQCWCEVEKTNSSWINSTLKTIDTNIKHPRITTKRPSELYLPVQTAIYAYLWRSSLTFSQSSDCKESMSPAISVKRCQHFWIVSHILAEDLAGNHLECLFTSARPVDDLSSVIRSYFNWLGNKESNMTALLGETCQCTGYEQDHLRIRKLHNLQKRDQNTDQIHAHCREWLQDQALESLDALGRLGIGAKCPSSPFDTRPDTKTDHLSSAFTDHLLEMISDRDDATMSYILNGGPVITTQVPYLYSSSIRGSMRSMLSMASRIKKNARGSVLATPLQWSGNNTAMSISGSFSFSRVTGMGSAYLPAQDIDTMEVEEETSLGQEIVDLLNPVDKQDIEASIDPIPGASRYGSHIEAMLVDERPISSSGPLTFSMPDTCEEFMSYLSH